MNCPLARLITGEHLQRGKLQNNISLEVKIKMGPHRLKCPWAKILQNQYPNSAVCRPQKTTDRFCLSRVYTMAMVQIYRPPMWVWKVGIPLNVNIYIKRNIIWDLTMDIWGILFQTNPYTVVSIHICYVYIYMIIYVDIYIYIHGNPFRSPISMVPELWPGLVTGRDLTTTSANKLLLWTRIPEMSYLSIFRIWIGCTLLRFSSDDSESSPSQLIAV